MVKMAKRRWCECRKILRNVSPFFNIIHKFIAFIRWEHRSGMKNNSGPEFVYTTSQVSIAVPFLICQIRLYNVEGIVGNFNENF